MTTQLDFLRDADESLMTPRLEEAVRALRAGKPILLQDASDRENEGDLVIAAEKIETASMNFLIKKGSGIVCLALSQEKLDQLGLPMMIADNTNLFQTAFTVSIEAKVNVSTGVSAQDRAQTLKVAMADDAKPKDLRRPGHVFPLAAKSLGVFERMGHTEGSVDLMKIAGLRPGAALCELMNSDGSMSAGRACSDFAREFNIPILSVEEVLFHRIKTENIFERTQPKRIESNFGPLLWHRFVFFDQSYLELFIKEEAPTRDNHRLTVSSGDNLNNRFMAQLLASSEDDPLFQALTDLKNDETDVVVMMPERAQAQTDSSSRRRHLAFLCRALRELSHSKLSVNASELALVAEHFSIKITSPDKL